MRAALLAAAVAGLALAGCAGGGVHVIDRAAETPGAAGGPAQVRLEREVAEGEIAIDGEVVSVFADPIRAVVVHGLQPGAHRILVLARGGPAQEAAVTTGARLTTARAAPRPWSSDEDDALERRVDLFLPPEPPPRPCSRFGVIAHLRLGAGVRLCQPIGRHLSLEALAGWFVVNGGAELGVTFHPSTSDWVPYLALRRGAFFALVGAGDYWAPGVGWRFGRHFLELGAAWIHYQPNNGDAREHLGPAFIFGWD